MTDKFQEVGDFSRLALQIIEKYKKRSFVVYQKADTFFHVLALVYYWCINWYTLVKPLCIIKGLGVLYLNFISITSFRNLS